MSIALRMRSPARQGTLIVVVLALIAIFMSLILAMTVRVYNTTKGSMAMQQSAQAFCMLQAAKMVVRDAPPAAPLTGADEVGPIANRLMPDRLGWFRISGSGPYEVIAAGGASAAGGAGKNTIDAGDPLVNQYENRWHYRVQYASPGFVVAVQPAAAPADYPW